MESSLQKSMLPFKIQQLLEIIIAKKRLEIKDALLYLYSSQLYKKLSLESSYLWQLSSFNLYEYLKKERIQKDNYSAKNRSKKQSRTESAQLLLFFSFCIENYKVYKKKGAEETLQIFNEYNVFDYLDDVFETLHTQSSAYIMSEINSYIKKQQRNQK